MGVVDNDLDYFKPEALSIIQSSQIGLHKDNMNAFVKDTDHTISYNTVIDNARYSIVFYSRKCITSHMQKLDPISIPCKTGERSCYISDTVRSIHEYLLQHSTTHNAPSKFDYDLYFRSKQKMNNNVLSSITEAYETRHAMGDKLGYYSIFLFILKDIQEKRTHRNPTDKIEDSIKFLYYVAAFTNGQSKTQQIFKSISKKTITEAKCLFSLFMIPSNIYDVNVVDSFDLNVVNCCNWSKKKDQRYAPSNTKQILLEIQEKCAERNVYGGLNMIVTLIKNWFKQEWVNDYLFKPNDNHYDMTSLGFQTNLDKRCHDLMTKLIIQIPGLKRIHSLQLIQLSAYSGLLPLHYATWATLDNWSSVDCNDGAKVFETLKGVEHVNVIDTFKQSSMIIRQHLGIYPSFLENFLCEQSRDSSDVKYEYYYKYQSLYQLRFDANTNKYSIKEKRCDGTIVHHLSDDIKMY